MKSKKASLLYEAIIHLILIALIFGLFLMISASKTDSRGVKQQVLEKQTALLIDSAVPVMEFSIAKESRKGIINNIEIKEGRVFVYVDGLTLSEGYPYFSRYNVEIEKNEKNFVIKIGDKK